MRKKKRIVAVALSWVGMLFVGWQTARADTVHVSNDGTHESPFETWQKAATNINEALIFANQQALNVLVSNGLYRVTNELAVSAGITVQSLNGPAETTIYRDAAFGNFRIVNVSHAGALVSGFTVTNGFLNAQPGAGFYLTAGTVSNCVITLCGVANAYNGAVDMTGGLMTGCVISNALWSGYNRNVVVLNGASAVLEDSEIVNNGKAGVLHVGERSPLVITGGATARRCRIYNNAVNGQAGGVTVNNGRLENSLVYNNYNHANNAGGVLIDHASGQLVNSTVSRNWKNGAPTFSGVRRTAGSVINSILYANAGTAPGDNYDGDVSACSYSCAPELTSGTGNVAGNPLFLDADAYDFRLAIGSPALDTGTNLVSVTTDIDRTARPLAADSRGVIRHDMGAYEKDGAQGALDVGFLGDSLVGMNAVTSVFSAAVAGTNTAITWWGWDFNGDGTNELAGADLATVTNAFGPGRYSISVSVSNSVGETATATRSNYVLVVERDIYVAEGGGHKVPFASWADAATNLNDAVDIAQSGCTVHVSNGSYRITKTIGLFSDITIRSVNGPDVTTVWRDASAPRFGLLDIRDPGAFVSGLTLTNGNVIGGGGSAISMTAGTVSNLVISRCLTEASYGGVITLTGGLMIDCLVTNMAHWYPVVVLSGTAIVEDCRFTSSTTSEQGFMQINSGGLVRRCRFEHLSGNAPYVRIAAGGALENSLVYKTAASGIYLGPAGGVYMLGGRMVNCTISGCTRTSGTASGVYRTGGSITNSIIFGNGAGAPMDNYSGDISAVWHSCAPELGNSEQGNMTVDPRFANPGDGNFRLAVGSLGVDSGTNIWSADDLDLDRNSRRAGAGVDMGAYETDPSTVPFSVAFNVDPAVGVGSVTSVVRAVVAGVHTTIVAWEWDLNNDGSVDVSGDDLAEVTAPFGLGQHSISVRVRNSVGEIAVATNLNCVLVVAPDIYVAPNATPVIPYSTWATAATNINDAVDIAQAGCTVHVADGSYPVSRKLDLFSGFTVRSVNGPELTTVWGDASAGHFRMFDLRDGNAIVTGLTMTNSGTEAGSALNMTAGMVSNCVITSCFPGYVSLATLSGGLLTDCVITNNSASLGMLLVSGSGVVDNCVIAHNTVGDQPLIQLASGTIRRSRIASNRSTWRGYVQVTGSGRLENSLVHNNTNASSTIAAGVYLNGGVLINCTITGNYKPGTGSGVNRNSGTVTNCIIFGNGVGAAGDNYSGAISAVWNSCAPELTPGVQGNFAADPLFLDAHYRIGARSPCIGTGFYDSSWMNDALDLEGNPRVRSIPKWAGTVDMGCYQAVLPPTGMLFKVR